MCIRDRGMLRGDDFKVTVKGSAATTASAALTGATGGFAGTNAVTTTTFAAASAAATGSNSYSIEIEAVGKRSANGTGQIKFRVMNTKTGEISEWQTATVNATGHIVNGSAISTNLVGIKSAVLTSANASFNAGATWEAGDKALISVAGARAEGADSGTVQIGSTGSTVHILSLIHISEPTRPY